MSKMRRLTFGDTFVDLKLRATNETVLVSSHECTCVLVYGNISVCDYISEKQSMYCNSLLQTADNTM